MAGNRKAEATGASDPQKSPREQQAARPDRLDQTGCSTQTLRKHPRPSTCRGPKLRVFLYPKRAPTLAVWLSPVAVTTTTVTPREKALSVKFQAR